MIKIYLIGGAVRDIILGKQPTDYDFVVGATPEIILEAAFTQGGITSLYSLTRIGMKMKVEWYYSQPSWVNFKGESHVVL